MHGKFIRRTKYEKGNYVNIYARKRNLHRLRAAASH